MQTYRDPGQMEQFLQDLFGPDLILPEQFYAARGHAGALSGERALMWAVLTDGIESFRRTSSSAVHEDSEEYQETLTWLLATDWDWAFSFANLCELFGFDPESMRKALLDWHERGQAGSRRQRFRPVSLRAA